MSHPQLQHQPAAELISNALQKIKKLAGNKKHAELGQQCQLLIDSIHEVLSPEYALRAVSKVPQRTRQGGQQHAAVQGLSNQQQHAEQGPEAAKAPAAASEAEAKGSQTSSTPKGTDAAAAAPATPSAQSTASARSASIAGTAQESAALQPVPLPPAHDLAQRTETAISDAAAVAVMQVLHMAVATLKPNILEVALDLIHKLIAFRYLQGAAHNVQMDKHDETVEGSTAAAAGQQYSGSISPQGLAVQLICKCDDVADEGVEVYVLRGLLTATTSHTFTLHGQALLLAVRTCYNIHLMSRSEVNQTTAKATLTQMLNVVFQRMEAASIKITVKPIVVADMLGTASQKASSMDISGMATAVQGFLNNVVAAAGYGAAMETSEQVRQSVAEAMSAPRHSMDLDSRAHSATSPAATPKAVAAASGNSSAIEQHAAAVTSIGAAAIGADAADECESAGVLSAGISGNISDDEEFQDDVKNTFQLATSDSIGSSKAKAAIDGQPADATPAVAVVQSPGTTPAAAAAKTAATAGAKGVGSLGTGGMAGLSPVASVLLKDALLVFRALCKLSIRTSDSVTVSDPTAVRGKLLALELLKVLLENSGPTFRSNERFTASIRQYLCLSLLKNSASSVPAALQLSASIFLSLLQKFRGPLKAEVGIFFPMLMLKVLEPPAAVGAAGTAAGIGSAAQQSLAVNSYSYKVVVLRCLREACTDGQLLVDLFVNYDCDLNSSNLFERLVNGLVKIAQASLPTAADHQQLQQEQWLRQEALQCLASAAEALWVWYKQNSGQGTPAALSSRDDDAAAPPLGISSSRASTASLVASASAATRAQSAAASNGSGNDSAAATPRGSSPPASINGSATGAAASSVASASAGAAGAPAATAGAGDALSKKRAYKEKWQEGIALFNTKPKKGIAMLQNEDMLGRSAEDVATFLAKTEGLDKTLIGDYLGEREDFNLKVMHAYVDALDFIDMEFDTAIRRFLQGFRLPGEAQKIDRLMEKFAERFLKCNPASFKSADVAYVLAYSVILLNTDAHNPQVKKKMSVEDFLKNNRGINDGQDLPQEFVRSVYDRIVNNEIKMKDDLVDSASAKQAAEAAQRGNLLMNALWSIVGGYKQAESAEPSDDAIKTTLDKLHERAKGATYFIATDSDTVRPMLELTWAPLLGCFSLLFDEYSDPRLLNICLAGFEACTCLVAQLGVSNLRDVFVNSLCNFTHLHSPSTMKPKNGLAFRALLNVALQVGNHLDGRWLEVLRCVSRWELLQQIASGMPTDAVLFAGAAGAPTGAEKGLGKAGAAFKEQLKRLGTNTPAQAAGLTPAASGGVRSMDTLAMSEASIKQAHIGAGSGGNKDEETLVPPDIINSVDTAQLNKVYMSSSSLDSDGIVAFVRCLATISQDELRDARAPRVFSLTKIVEISHFNMARIRLVWSRIWAVLSQYFIAVGCHSNLAVAMYAVDSLRQLAMKFLERDELANYTFQNDFMRPFVVVMRQSQAVEIRELIIRCLSQMVLARVNNVKSGWKSMFMVFTTAAGDADPTIVRLAFDTIEKIVREHFGHITETETATFTDCVNCLIAFTNNPHSMTVALNAIAFLRYCAFKLAEGAIGDLPSAVSGVDAEALGPTCVVAIDNTARPGPASNGFDSSAAAVGTISSSRAQAEGDRGTATTAQRASLKFVDRDEHVYFWFPLLAGLSELTFDPRPEIRRSALEVLFDVLKTHGGSFAESFWCRIFERVLLPIFDHVRAEVTDTTTFTSERRRQQEDAWLYETCTHCLQHLVDLFSQYYELMLPLLRQLLALLKSFISRSHASLANVGVAAYTRLVANCGPQLQPHTWTQVTDMLQQVIQETLPYAAELVTPPHKQASQDDIAAAAAATGSRQSFTTSTTAATTGQPRPPYTLREGVGLRRLLKFHVQANVQLLLVQAASAMYAQHYQHMAAEAMVQLANSLQLAALHARRTNTDLQLRWRVAAQQAEDRVQEDRQIPDPPLLRQETDACHAYLSMLLHLTSSREAGSPRSAGGSLHWKGAAVAQEATRASQRLVELSYSVLERFGNGVTAGSSHADSSSTISNSQHAYANGVSPRQSSSNKASWPGGVVVIAAPQLEYAAFAPVVVSTLKALNGLDELTFKQQLSRFFPVLTQLMSAEYATADVQRALSQLFLTRVGPMLPAIDRLLL